MSRRVYQNILIINAETETNRLLLEVLAARALRGAVARDRKTAAEMIASRAWDMVLADLHTANGDGLTLLRAVKENAPETPVVLLGDRDSSRLAVRALREGFDDYLGRPLDRRSVEELLDTLTPSHEVPIAASAEENTRSLYQIAGNSAALNETLRLADKVAPTSIPVLITGESGTGKELISYYIHDRSSRSHGPYVRVNCAALSETLLESELFGHERGAFTGAHAQRKGRFERAHGGTLLLDEISETSPRLQAELLRVLEQQDFERVGGTESICVNVRIISTSNRDLSAEVEKGTFRRDLYYRLAGVHLTAPALRERRQDIPALVWHFVNLYARETHRRITELDSRLLDAFASLPWPGNVRQLRNVVRAAMALGAGPVLSIEDIASLQPQLGVPAATPAVDSLRLQELEKQAILEALRRTKSHQAKAARLLGITDRTLREKLRRYRNEETLDVAGESRWLQQSI